MYLKYVLENLVDGIGGFKVLDGMDGGIACLEKRIQAISSSIKLDEIIKREADLIADPYKIHINAMSSVLTTLTEKDLSEIDLEQFSITRGWLNSLRVESVCDEHVRRSWGQKIVDEIKLLTDIFDWVFIASFEAQKGISFYGHSIGLIRERYPFSGETYKYGREKCR